jgi:3-phosphoshikimate 1-carboxyvinyltransferase
MIFSVRKSRVSGSVHIPGSKSHTIRALAFSLMAEGKSGIKFPLISSDTISGLEMIKSLGAEVKEKDNIWSVTGTGGCLKTPENVIDIGNSGTSLYIGLGLASLINGYTIFTGDAQIRRRPVQGLLDSLNRLGAETVSTRQNGLPPVILKGPMKGGITEIEAVTSQYLTSLLIACAFAENKSVIHIRLLNEKPYVEMTLAWMDRLGLKYENDDFKTITVPGRQKIQGFEYYVPADFSSAAFFMAAAAVTKSELVLNGLDYNDTQGDKALVGILEKMGCEVKIGNMKITINGSELTGNTFDLNAIPDTLPALAVAACFAEGETRLVNVPQARLKETDRISVMSTELKKMGADIDELPDGLVIRKSKLNGAKLDGHGDHRVVMALSVAGLAAGGFTEINTAEAVSVTFPDFFNLMKSIGADIIKLNEAEA